MKYQIKTGSVITGLSQTVFSPARSQIALLSNEYGTADRVDDVVIAFGVDDFTVPQGLSLGAVVFNFQIV